MKQALSECAFDPRSPGPLKTLVELGNANYLEMRAIEILTDLTKLTSEGKMTTETYGTEMRFVIGLLTLAGIKRGAFESKTRKARSQDSREDRKHAEAKGLDS